MTSKQHRDWSLEVLSVGNHTFEWIIGVKDERLME